MAARVLTIPQFERVRAAVLAHEQRVSPHTPQQLQRGDRPWP